MPAAAATAVAATADVTVVTNSCSREGDSDGGSASAANRHHRRRRTPHTATAVAMASSLHRRRHALLQSNGVALTVTSVRRDIATRRQHALVEVGAHSCLQLSLPRGHEHPPPPSGLPAQLIGASECVGGCHREEY